MFSVYDNIYRQFYATFESGKDQKFLSITWYLQNRTSWAAEGTRSFSIRKQLCIFQLFEEDYKCFWFAFIR